MKLFFLSLPLIVIVAVAGYFYFHRAATDNVHYHAGFVVYVDGKKQDYSGTQFMSLEACSTGSQADVHRTGEAHLHDNVGDVVHVHHTAVPWETLFKTMGVKFPSESVTGYVNGKQVPDIMYRLIEPDDSAIIVVGKKIDIKQSDYVTVSHIRSVASKSESCGT